MLLLLSLHCFNYYSHYYHRHYRSCYTYYRYYYYYATITPLEMSWCYFIITILLLIIVWSDKKDLQPNRKFQSPYTNYRGIRAAIVWSILTVYFTRINPHIYLYNLILIILKKNAWTTSILPVIFFLMQ